MKYLHLYTKEDAVKDINQGKSGAACSVKKWKSIQRALILIHREMIAQEGLCMVLTPKANCRECLVGNNLRHEAGCDHNLKKAIKDVASASARIRILLKLLKRIERKEKPCGD